MLARVKDEDGDSNVAELRFIVRSQAAEASAALSAYWRVMGEGLATLKVNYVAAKRGGDLEKTEPELPLFDGQDKPEPVEHVLKDEQGQVVRRFESREQKRAGHRRGQGQGCPRPGAAAQECAPGRRRHAAPAWPKACRQEQDDGDVNG